MEDFKNSNDQQLVVFSYSNPFYDALQYPERFFTFFGIDITISQGWKSGGKGGTSIGFGASVYDCSIIICFFLEKHSHLVRNNVVVELGSGPGLATICAAIGGSKIAIATDGDEDSVALSNQNIVKNSINKDAMITSTKLLWDNQSDIEKVKSVVSNSLETRFLVSPSYIVNHNDPSCFPISTISSTPTATLSTSFSSSQSVGDIGKADLIIASDVAGLPYADAYSDLVDTMLSLCKPDGMVLLTYQRRHSIEDEFFKLLNQAFHVIRLPRSEIHKDFRHLPVFIYQCTIK